MSKFSILVLIALIVVSANLSSSLGIDDGFTASEEVIVQKLPVRKAITFDEAMERDLGCRELMCVSKCNAVALPKCLKSESCALERDKICQKRCRKTRCDDRCEDEPQLGYVEREQGLEKCKDACAGPTASHNECIVKCHVKFKPCKSRCYETASKYKCVNPKIFLLALENPLFDGDLSSFSSSSQDSAGGADENAEIKLGANQDDECEDLFVARSLRF